MWLSEWNVWTSKSLYPIIYEIWHTSTDIWNYIKPSRLLFCKGKNIFETSLYLYMWKWAQSSSEKKMLISPMENTFFTCSAYLRTTCFCFKLLSPSRPEVSMWQIPSGSVEKSKTISAGMTSLQERWIKSPTVTSFQHLSTYFFSFLKLKKKKKKFKKNLKPKTHIIVFFFLILVYNLKWFKNLGWSVKC